jgi:membrane fusion protein (multidrug efflux system)
VRLDVIDDGIIIPQRCITELQGNYSVKIINEQNMVETRAIKVGPRYRDFWVISEGLNIGEKVVYEGLQKVNEGDKVNPVIQDVEPINQ